MKNFKQKALTLIELIIVIVIIGILSAAIVKVLNDKVGDANDTKRVSAFSDIIKTIESYSLVSGGGYPIEESCIVEAGEVDRFYCETLRSVVNLSEIDNNLYNETKNESDPNNIKGVWYISDSSSFQLYTYLEDGRILSYNSETSEYKYSETTPDIVFSMSLPTVLGIQEPSNSPIMEVGFNDGGIVCNIYVDYWNVDTPQTIHTATSLNQRSGVSSLSLSNIVGSANYEYEVTIENEVGSDVETGSFITGSVGEVGAPSISLVSTNNITQNTADLIVTFNDGGIDSNITLDFGLDTSYGQTQTKYTVNSGDHTFSLYGLVPNETYFYRITAQNIYGSSQETGTFSTISATPQVGTISVSNETCDTANINVDLLDSGNYTVSIYYGLDETYSETPLVYYNQPQGNQTYQLTTLTANSTYYYKVVVSNTIGEQTTTGTFNTLITVSIDSETNFINGSTVTITTDIQSGGYATDISIEYGTTTAYGSTSPILENQNTGTHQIVFSIYSLNTYHYRVKIENSFGTFYSTDNTFSITSLFTCSITSDTCSGVDIMHVYDPSGGHAELYTQLNYNYKVCCSGIDGLSNENIVNSAVALNLYSETNSHVEKSTESNYSYKVYIGGVGKTATCNYASDCSSLGSGYTCLVSISDGDTNLHVGECTAFTTKVCCKIE